MIDLKTREVWFITGSQHLYGEETLLQVTQNSTTIAHALNENPAIPVQIIYKPTVKTAEEIYSIFQQANNHTSWYWCYYLDAHVFSSKNVDPGFKNITQTAASFTYTI